MRLGENLRVTRKSDNGGCGCEWLFLIAAMWLIWRLAIKVGDPLVERIAYWLWVVPLALYAIGLVFGIVLLLLALFSSKQG
jgi:hypothetical protein